MVTAADRFPLAAGLKVTVLVQVVPAASVLPQVLVWVKSDVLAPVMEIPEMLTVVVLRFITTDDFAGEA